jgi:hypothetical protein
MLAGSRVHGSRVHNEAVALARLSAEHKQASSRGLRAGGSMNSNHSGGSAAPTNGVPAVLPKAV